MIELNTPATPAIYLFVSFDHIQLEVLEQFVLLLLFTRPLPRDGGMAEDHGALEAEQLPRIWTTGCKETESRQRVSGAKESVAGQCTMR